jgi:hypothetical protein
MHLRIDRRSYHMLRAQKPPKPLPHDHGRYVPELASRLEDDPNLCDGARRCARKIAEYAYRLHRDDRTPRITVTYLMKGLHRCRRTVQRYLRQLEEHGYIAVDVLRAGTRMCIGLSIRLLSPLFPRHAQKWPPRLIKLDATALSHNKSFLITSEPIPRVAWAIRCMDGVFRRPYVPFAPLTPAL